MLSSKYIIGIVLLLSIHSAEAKTKVYLFPGQGADHRLFSELKLPENYEAVFIKYPIPERRESLQEYAYHFIEKIDQSENYILVGASMGGMICSELADTLNPQKTILISSAKCRSELPLRYRFQRYILLNRLIPGFITKWGAQLLQPIVEPDRKKHKAIFKDMLKRKSPRYYKRTVNMIINWKKKTYNPNIIHIHGSKDHTLPIRRIEANHIINKGSHMMTLTASSKVLKKINQILEE